MRELNFSTGLIRVEITSAEESYQPDDASSVDAFISAKRIEGCSEKTLNYYYKTIKAMLEKSKEITFCENTVHIKSAIAENNKEEIRKLAKELI